MLRSAAAAAAILGGAIVAAATPRSIASDTPLDGLVASGPASDIAGKMMLFGRLVGVWDIDYTAHGTGGKEVSAKCEWNWAWVLDGRAVQDVWICPSRAERAREPGLTGEWGTTVRMYDPKRDAWRVVFVGPAFSNVNLLTAHEVGSTIVQEGTDTDGRPVHWNFTDITPASFRWYSEKSMDGGKTWMQQEQMLARRRATR
jgi:hypothetical protein